jgi:hypothetical protein
MVGRRRGSSPKQRLDGGAEGLRRWSGGREKRKSTLQASPCRDGAPGSAQEEREAVSEIAAMHQKKQGTEGLAAAVLTKMAPDGGGANNRLVGEGKRELAQVVVGPPAKREEGGGMASGATK